MCNVCTVRHAWLRDIKSLLFPPVVRCYCNIRVYIFLFTAQGICPGNRLRLLVGQYDTGGCLVGSRPDLTISEDGIQRHGKRRSWHVQPNRVSYTIPLLNSWGTEYFCIIYIYIYTRMPIYSFRLHPLSRFSWCERNGKFLELNF